ncbi:MAG: PEGA domain-containing protein, partial [Deltaproteobacteria bacterium]|nr:PEGA domain-containing protein [Deltaproteobacteria bacterium]
LAGVAGWLAFTPTEPVAVPPLPVSPVHVPDPAPATVPKPLPESPSPPARIQIRLRSDPAGATVLDGAREVGKTPFDLDFDRGQGSKSFVFRHKGYRDGAATVSLDAGGEVHARLDPIRDGRKAAVDKTTTPVVVPKPKDDGPGKVKDLKGGY